MFAASSDSASATNEAMWTFLPLDREHLSVPYILLRFLTSNEGSLGNKAVHFTLIGGLYVLVGYLPAL